MDLARFDVALTEGRLLSPASQRAMWSAGRSPSGAALPHDLGWFVQAYADEPLIWHSGPWEDAYSALYLKAPARHLTFILLANSDGLNWDNGLDEAAVHRSLPHSWRRSRASRHVVRGNPSHAPAPNR